MDIEWFLRLGVPPEQALKYAHQCMVEKVDSEEKLHYLFDDLWFTSTFLAGDRGTIRKYFSKQCL